MYRFYSPAGQTCRVSIVGEFKDGILQLAASRCSKKDNFNRKIGRSIAEGRLKSGKLLKAILTDNTDVKTFLEYAKPASEEVCNSKEPFKIQRNEEKYISIKEKKRESS